MSAQVWRRRRRTRPQYTEPFDWWDDRVLLCGPPPRKTRAQMARERRLASIARRKARRA